MIIAIDGPAAAGKGTIGRLLAKYYNLAYLDTGALYRAVALSVTNLKANQHNEAEVFSLANQLSPKDLENPMLRNENIGQLASEIAKMPKVRTALLEFQKKFAHFPPSNTVGAVVDGRDIGSVVLPNADYKFSITASEEARATRRWKELLSSGNPLNYASVLISMRERDLQDTQRTVSPLAPAKDSYLLDTTDLDIDAAFTAVKSYISSTS